MDRKLFGLFSGRQLTAIAMTAILAPSALFAAVSYTAVGIIDPLSGAKSLVDPSRRLWVFDPIAGYRNNPANLVNIKVLTTGGCTSTGYTVPAGKALIILSVSGQFFSPNGNGGIYIESDSNCENDVTQLFTSTAGYNPVNISLGAGSPVRAGSPIYAYSSNASSNLFINGYLIPAAALPAVGSAEAAQLEGPHLVNIKHGRH